jgi:hypothetical protein
MTVNEVRAKLGLLPLAPANVPLQEKPPVKKYNHNHDPENGQFTSGDGGGNGAASSKPAGWYDRNKDWVKPVAVGAAVVGGTALAIATAGAAVPEEIEAATLLTEGAEDASLATEGAVAGDAAASEVSNVITKAGQTVGNDGITVSSKSVAQDAAEQFVGEDSTPMYDRNTNEYAGQESADGTRQIRYTSANSDDPYINLENKSTGGNLHVRWKQ